MIFWRTEGLKLTVYTVYAPWMTGRRHISRKQHLLSHFYIVVVYRKAILKNKEMKGIICGFLLFILKLIWAYFLRISTHSLFLHICIPTQQVEEKKSTFYNFGDELNRCLPGEVLIMMFKMFCNSYLTRTSDSSVSGNSKESKSCS